MGPKKESSYILQCIVEASETTHATSRSAHHKKKEINFDGRAPFKISKQLDNCFHLVIANLSVVAKKKESNLSRKFKISTFKLTNWRNSDASNKKFGINQENQIKRISIGYWASAFSEIIEYYISHTEFISSSLGEIHWLDKSKHSEEFLLSARTIEKLKLFEMQRNKLISPQREATKLNKENKTGLHLSLSLSLWRKSLSRNLQRGISMGLFKGWSLTSPVILNG